MKTFKTKGRIPVYTKGYRMPEKKFTLKINLPEYRDLHKEEDAAQQWARAHGFDAFPRYYCRSRTKTFEQQTEEEREAYMRRLICKEFAKYFTFNVKFGENGMHRVYPFAHAVGKIFKEKIEPDKGMRETLEAYRSAFLAKPLDEQYAIVRKYARCMPAFSGCYGKQASRWQSINFRIDEPTPVLSCRCAWMAW